MNFYLVENQQTRFCSETADFLRKALQELYPDAVERSCLGFDPAQEDQILLVRGAGLIWAKIFFDSVTHADLDALQKEIDQLPQKFYGKIHCHILFPACNKGVLDSLLNLRGKPAILEYFFIQRRDERDLVLREHRNSYSGETRTLKIYPPCDSNPSGYRFFKQARLSHCEIEEFIAFDLDLQRHSGD